MSAGYMPPASTIETERARCIQLRMTGYSVAQAADMAGLTKDTGQSLLRWVRRLRGGAA